MTTKRIADGWRALSRTIETPYGTAESVSASYPFEGEPSQVKPVDTVSNENENKGLRDADSFDILTKMLEGNHTQRATPDLCALALASVLQKVTTDQPDNVNDPNSYRHYVERDLTAAGVELSASALTMIENDGVQQKVYAGIVGKSFQISTSRNGFAEIVWEFLGKGTEANDANAKPAVNGESYLMAGDLTINRGSALTGTVAGGNLALTGGSDLSAKVREFSYKVDNGARPVFEIGDQTKTVSRFEQGPRFTHELKIKFEMEDTTHHDALLAETEYALHLPILGGLIETNFNYQCTLWFPKVQYIEAVKTVEDGILVVDATFMVQEHATLGSVIAEVQNQITSYLG